MWQNSHDTQTSSPPKSKVKKAKLQIAAIVNCRGLELFSAKVTNICCILEYCLWFKNLFLQLPDSLVIGSKFWLISYKRTTFSSLGSFRLAKHWTQMAVWCFLIMHWNSCDFEIGLIQTHCKIKDMMIQTYTHSVILFTWVKTAPGVKALYRLLRVHQTCPLLSALTSYRISKRVQGLSPCLQSAL